jgi:ABC-2 type transport system permease protein
MAAAPATPAERAAGGGGSVLRIAARRARIELLCYRREPMTVIFVFAYPLLMMLMFASVFTGTVDGIGAGGLVTVSFAQRYLPGVVATAVVLSSVQLVGIQVAQDRDVGMLKRLRATPMPPVAYFLGLTGQVVVSLFLQIVLLLGVAALFFDVNLPTDPQRWVTFVWVCVLSAGAGTAAGIAIGGLMPNGRTASAFLIPFILLLQFISGVFIDFATLPEWMRDLAALFSLKWTAQGLRSVFLPDAFAAAEGTGSWQHALVAIVLTAWIVVWGAIALRTFRWLPQGES